MAEYLDLQHALHDGEDGSEVCELCGLGQLRGCLGEALGSGLDEGVEAGFKDVEPAIEYILDTHYARFKIDGNFL